MRAVRTWAKDAAEEDAMNDDHHHLWRQLIRHLQEDSLAGVYYAAIGCHTGNPQWRCWREIIGSYSNVEVQDYNLDDYAQAFFDAGFSVSARPYEFQGVVPLKKRNAYFPMIADSLHYQTFDKTLFRFVKD